MANDQQKKNQKEKVVYVGDSRVKVRTEKLVPRDYSAYPGKTEAFVPNFLLKEWMVGAVVLVGFMMLIIWQDPPLGYAADPTNTSFIPMPDWYFLFMYQLLKYPYMAEEFLVFGTIIVPGLMFGGLLLAPFLDTGKERRWYKRPIASSFMFASLAAVVFLTYVSWSNYQNVLAEQNIVPEHIERAEKIKRGQIEAGKSPAAAEEEPIAIVDEDDEGYQIYQRSACVGCHATDLNGMANIPGLRGIGSKFDREELVNIMKDGINTMPPGFWDASIEQGLTEDEMNLLADWLARQVADSDGDDAAEEVES